MKNHESHVILENVSIRDAVEKMAVEQFDLLVVVKKDATVISVFTSGDFHNAVLKGIDLNNKVSTIANKNFSFLSENYSFQDALKLFKEKKIVAIPVLKNNKLVDLLNFKNFSQIDPSYFKLKDKKIKTVIMAGGKGTRLDPFTKVIPKPLLPIGDDPIIELIMKEFISHGLKDFFITLNEKAKMIKAYFNDHNMEYNIKFVDEKKQLGTVGSLRLLKDVLDDVFFLSNSDILIKNNYSEILSFHQNGDYKMTIVGAMKQHCISYGVCEIETDGKLKSFKEKPTIDYLVNTGFYVINPSVIKYIPKDTYFDMTDLLKSLMNKGERIGVYPVSEKSWIDVGQWKELGNTLNDVRFN